MSVTDAGQRTNDERTLKIELLGQWKLDDVFRNEMIIFFYNLPSTCCEFESATVFKVILQKTSEHHPGNIEEHWHRTWL